jgi:ADP-heptose:LPS heptosyltransferase
MKEIKILIMANQGLGDIIMMLPTLKGMIAEFRNIYNIYILVKSNIEFNFLSEYLCTKSINIIVLKQNSYISYNIFSLISLIFNKFDIVISPMLSDKLRNKLFLKCLNSKKIYTKNDFAINNHIQIRWDKNLYRHKCEYINYFFSEALSFSLSNHLVNYINSKMKPLKINFTKEILVAVGPGCGRAERFKVASNKVIADSIKKFSSDRDLKIKVIIYGTSYDREILIDLRELLLDYSPQVIIDFNFTSLVKVLENCALVITGDSGPGHIASLTSSRILCISGPTNPSETGPYTPFIKNVRITRFACAPCYREEFTGGCDQNDCMDKISIQQVSDAIWDILHNKFNNIKILNKQSYFRIEI